MRPRAGAELQSEPSLANQTEKVTVLITAESIIAGFMFTYGALVGQMLVHWSEICDASLFTTFAAGVLIYAIVLTSFRSILLLFKSIDTNAQSAINYEAGYYLFVASIFFSGVYVVLNIVSIFLFTVGSNHKPLPFPATPWSQASLVLFSCYVAVLLIRPHWLGRRIHCCGHWIATHVGSC